MLLSNNSKKYYNPTSFKYRVIGTLSLPFVFYISIFVIFDLFNHGLRGEALIYHLCRYSCLTPLASVLTGPPILVWYFIVLELLFFGILPILLLGGYIKSYLYSSLLNNSIVRNSITCLAYLWIISVILYVLSYFIIPISPYYK